TRSSMPAYLRLITSLFFFQAEDGIRDLYVTGVQTCALPISARRHDAAVRHLQHRCHARRLGWCAARARGLVAALAARLPARGCRSEERRVGKEWRSRWSAYH